MMRTVNIFVTGPLASVANDFESDDARFHFAPLDGDGPRQLADGPVFAFIDWVLPTMSGLELCRRVRADRRLRDAHVTMVLEQDDENDRRRALAAGADDYVVGPLDRNGVLDRILALQSARPHRSGNEIVELGPLTIDRVAMMARWNDTRLALRPNEFRLLRFFAENADRVLTRRELIEGLGKQEQPLDERTVDVWIGRLRKALKAAGAGDPLRTIRSVGYVFDAS